MNSRQSKFCSTLTIALMLTASTSLNALAKKNSQASQDDISDGKNWYRE